MKCRNSISVVSVINTGSEECYSCLLNNHIQKYRLNKIYEYFEFSSDTYPSIYSHSA